MAIHFNETFTKNHMNLLQLLKNVPLWYILGTAKTLTLENNLTGSHPNDIQPLNYYCVATRQRLNEATCSHSNSIVTLAGQDPQLFYALGITQISCLIKADLGASRGRTGTSHTVGARRLKRCTKPDLATFPYKKLLLNVTFSSATSILNKWK